jgi:hypothetical protein
VKLEIQGDSKDGYHLVMTPDGFFTADTWHATVDEAMAEAESLFGLSRERWAKSN